MKVKKIIKIPIKILYESEEDSIEYIIQINKDYEEFKNCRIYTVILDILKEVDKKLWEELMK